MNGVWCDLKRTRNGCCFCFVCPVVVLGKDEERMLFLVCSGLEGKTILRAVGFEYWTAASLRNL